MAINFNHSTNDISASSGNVTLNGAAAPSSTLTIDNKTGAYTIVAGDNGKIINCTSGSFTVSLTAAATLGAGFNCWIWNTSTTTAHQISIDPNGSEQIDGLASNFVLTPSQKIRLVCTGTGWVADQRSAEQLASNGTGTRGQATGQNSVVIGGGTASGSNSISFSPVGAGATASSSNSAAIGSNSGSASSQAVTGAGAMALGGSYASGIDSFAAAVANNTSTYGAQGSNSGAIGTQAKATATNSWAIGDRCVASAATAIALGQLNTSGGAASFTAGSQNTAASTYSTAIGGSATATQVGKYAFASGPFAAQGDAQFGLMVLRASTTGTAVVMTSDGAAAGSANQLIVASNQVMAFTGTLIGKQSGSANIAAYEIKGTLVNNAGTVTMPTGTLTLIGTDSIGLTGAATLAADNTNKGLTVTSGYKTATNIRWVCTIRTSEVSYA
jgi:hypothetical protein